MLLLPRLRGLQRRSGLALVLSFLMAVPAAMPSAATPEADPGEPDWPPEAWRRGAVAELSLAELALIVAGRSPDSPSASSLADELDRLDDLPALYKETARTTLEGLARALWHQEQAMKDLSASERQLVAGSSPEGPLTPELQRALQKLDQGELMQALSALSASAQTVQTRLQESGHGVAHAIGEALGGASGTAPSEATPATGERPLRHQILADDGLAGVPQLANDAILRIMDALEPFAGGTPPDHDDALRHLGQVIDDVRPALEIVSAAALAHRLTRPDSNFRIPDPDAPRPDLRVGIAPPTRPGSRGEAPDLADAVRVLALQLGDPATANQAPSHAQALGDALAPEQVDAVARVLAAASGHITAQQRAATTLPPAGVDASRIVGWARALQDDALPQPGSADATALLDAVPHMDALQDAESARDELLSAVEDLVGDFVGPKQASSHCGVPGADGPVTVGFLLAVDTCGEDTVWTQPFLLTVDAGGNDEYLHRAGAPFAATVVDENVAGQTVQRTYRIPIQLVVDAGGSDTYEASNETGVLQACAQGAACTDFLRGVQDPTRVEREVDLPESSFGDLTIMSHNVSDMAPVSVLVDWQVDGGSATNTFTAGDRSQGHATSHGSGGQWYREATIGSLATGVLLERAGAGAELTSSYVAGDKSQGMADACVLNPPSQVCSDKSYLSSTGTLVRLVGADSTATASFTAGDWSQGVSRRQYLGTQLTAGGLLTVGGLWNTAGAGATSNDDYTAGADSQARTALGSDLTGRTYAFFVDAVGPGGTSHDTYKAGSRSRGYSERSSDYSTLALFVDAAAPDRPGLEGVGTEGDALVLAPSLDATARSDDTYLGNGTARYGYGGNRSVMTVFGTENIQTTTGVAGVFLDLGGNDFYELPDDGVFPGNDRVWNCGPWCSADASYTDGDRDGVPDLLENLWTDAHTDHSDPPPGSRQWDRDPVPGLPSIWEDFGPFLWGADPDDPSRSPAPTPPAVLVIPPTASTVDPALLDRPYAAVLNLGALDNTYDVNFSAMFHLDLGGDDVYLGHTASASGTLPETEPTDIGGSGSRVDEATARVVTDEAEDGPPAQHALSFLLDLFGDDRYLSPGRNGTQGFGDDGAAGLLFDLSGSDTYVAGSWSQGAGRHGGLGVLVDLGTPGAEEANHFRASPPSQGVGQAGGVGLLVATGDHNEFPGGVDVARDGKGGENGEGGEGTGIAANAADRNLPPQVHGPVQVFDAETGEPVVGVLRLDHEYRFQVNMTEPDEDDAVVCWGFGHGTGETKWECQDVMRIDGGERTATMEFTWNETFQVRSGDDLDRPDQADYTVTVRPRDSVGLAGDDLVQNVTIHNDAPGLLGGVIGPRLVRVGDTTAYQVPFDFADDLRQPLSAVTWGDGSRNATGSLEWLFGDIQWGRHSRGAGVHLPEGVPKVGHPTQIGAPQIAALGSTSGELGHVIDGEVNTRLEFATGSPDNRAAHVFVTFDQPRHIGRVQVHASSTRDVNISVETIGLNNVPRPERVIQVQEGAGVQSFTLDLADTTIGGGLPRVAGVVLRQLPDQVDTGNGAIFIHEVSLTGPGAFHTWESAGTFDLSYAVVDEYGGRNTTTAEVTVQPRGFVRDHDEAPFPVALTQAAGRGAVHHVSLARTDGEPSLDPLPCGQGQRNSTLFVFEASGASGELVIDWGDGTSSTVQAPGNCSGRFAFNHWWDDVGSHPVQVIFTRTGGEARTETLAVAHVEEAFDLWYEGDPLLFLALGDATTWHGGARYHATVDRAGDDRYIGQVAAPRNPLARSTGLGQQVETNEGARPSLVIDIGGDDDYLSRQNHTQGFGYLGAVALLFDVAGDDRYIAPGNAQGAAFKHGVGALVDLGGDDAFNIVLSDHPDVLAGLSDVPVPWAKTGGMRPPALDASRGPLRGSLPGLVQGAAEEGVGILVLDGGKDILVAGDRAQGHGSRNQVSSSTEYLAPDPDCFEPTRGEAQQAVTTSTLFPHTPGILCVLGIEFEYDPFLPGSTWSAPAVNTVGCPGSNQFTPIADCALNFEGTLAFLSSGPRPGPGTGILLRSGGPTQYNAGDWSQGAAGPGGRGILIDRDGGMFASATAFGQAYARNGQAVFATGGQQTLWLGGDGQAYAVAEGAAGDDPVADATAGPEPHAGTRTIALHMAPDRDDAWCGAAACNGAAPAFFVPADLMPPGPTVHLPQLDEENLFEHRADTFVLKVHLDEAPVPHDHYDVVVFSQPYMSWTSTSCTGSPLGPPALVAASDIAVAEGETIAQVEMDFEASLVDGPALPAGCHRLRVLARGLSDDAPVTGWTMHAGNILALPASNVTATGADQGGLPVYATSGSPISLQLASTQPLAASGTLVQFDVELRVVDEDDNDVLLQEPIDILPWQTTPGGAVRDIEITLPAASGVYTLLAKTGWSDDAGTPYGDEAPIATLVSDMSPPSAELESMQAWWRNDQPILASGEAMDLSSDVASLRIRLLETDGGCPAGGDACAIELRPPTLILDDECLEDGLPDNKCVVEVVHRKHGSQVDCDTCEERSHAPAYEVEAALHRLPSASTSEWRWETILDPTSNAFPGGRLLMQLDVTDTAGQSSGWTDVGLQSDGTWSLGIDRLVPEIDIEHTDAATNRANHPVPIIFNVVLTDCAVPRGLTFGACVPGSGLDWQSATVLFRREGSHTLQAVSATSADPLGDADGSMRVAFEWSEPTPPPDGSPSPPEGKYEFIVQVRDNAGNLLSFNPGTPFVIDRTSPSITAVKAEIPEDQEWIKPGDTLSVFVDVREEGSPPTQVEGVFVCVVEEGTPCTRDTGVPLDPFATDAFAGDVSVPDGLPDGPLVVSAVAYDAADNHGSAALDETMQYYSLPPEIGGLVLDVRAETILAAWSTSRPATVIQASAEPIGGGAVIEADVDNDATTSHVLRFNGLSGGTQYHVIVRVRDAAGHIAEVVNDDNIMTPVPAVSTLVLDPAPVIPRSGTVDVGGRVANPVTAKASLHIHAIDGTLLEAPVLLGEIDVEAGSEAFHFAFQDIDTKTTPGFESTLLRAADITFLVVVDDQIKAVEDTTTIRIDNAPPMIAPHVLGAPPTPHGWYNRSVLVDAGTSDDTHPISHFVRWATDGGDPTEWQPRRLLRIESDGRNEVDFRALDAADPPILNTFNGFVVNVDRVAPELAVALANNVTRDAVVPLTITSSDATSGVVGNRTRVGGGPWSSWGASPDSITLDLAGDGEAWIDVEVIDRAGNVRRQSVSVVLDRVGPTLVTAQWIGVSSEGRPVLQVVAEDTLNGTGRPAGVQAVRFLVSGQWTDWVPTDGLDALQAPVGVDPTKNQSIQFRDQAGNVGDPATVASPPNDTIDPAVIRAPPPPVDLLRDPLLSHKYGDANTRFTFSVVASPMDGKMPDRVWLRIGDINATLTPRGVPLADGAGLYVATLILPPSSLESASYRFHAQYGSHVATTDPLPAPIVASTGMGSDETVHDTDRRSPGLGWIVIPVLAVVGRHLRKQGQRS